MRHLDLFSGIGGFALAAKWTWGNEYENVGHSEVEKFPCRVYHRHFPESPCLGDITKIKWTEGQADFITAGFPCQPHSVAGKRKGGGDTRDLWCEVVRAIRRVRPKYALLENTPALLSSDRGFFFNQLLSDLAEIGYDAEWNVISAADVGAPQIRQRLWIFSYPNEKRRRPTPEESVFTRWPTIEFRTGWSMEPAVGRVAYGVPDQLDRGQAIGNAIVPQVAQIIMEAIKQVDSRGSSEGGHTRPHGLGAQLPALTA